MTTGVRTVYAVGFGLGLAGSVAAAAGLALAGSPATGGIALGATFVFVLGLADVFDREDFDRDHSLAYRLGNWGGAVLAVALGLVMLAVGVASVVAFG
ncbi:hypothetical protein [Halosimplex halophilum]|uniref:hypothetical protein n=1 Tax=Halosimplex halophilum TaxID=2559572 RepID=UPI00107F197E|nr:hypothetical protein [Halosimplex halophilum]